MLSVLRALQRAGVRYVLVGELAEVLHGSPLLPLTASVSSVPQAGRRDGLMAAIAAGGGTGEPASATPAVDASMSPLGVLGMSLEVVPALAGTRGYDDLRRDAVPVRLGEDLEVIVAPLVDLVRIAEAAGDQARVPALRRTFELATDGPVARAA